MRHNSERVPGKNFRSLAGRPLYHYILETLLSVPEVTQVVVDTDSPVILEALPRWFPGVLALERPEHLRAGEIPMNEVLLNTIGQLEADWFLQTHSTNPLLRPATVSAAIQDLPPVFEENSCLYIFRRETLVRRGNRLGERPLMFEIPREEAIDIDEEFDFKLAEAILRK
jgi:CMP-N-acetylneuraminic acid synthetase